MAKRPSLSDFLTNLDQPMPFHEKLGRLARNLAARGPASIVLWQLW